MSRPYHAHPIFKISNIGRPVDARYPTNKALLILMAVGVLGGCAWGWIDGGTLATAGSMGARIGATIFAAWALGRELDPDNPTTAFVAAALATSLVPLVGDVDLWTLAIAIALTRIVNRTIGPAARRSDLVLTLLVVAVAVLVHERWAIGIAFAIACACDAILPGGHRDRWAFVIAALALVVGLALRSGIDVAIPSATMLISAVVLTAAAATATTAAMESDCDLPGHQLDTRRVQAGILVALLLFVVAQFETSEATALGLAATLVAIVPGRLLQRVFWRRES